MHDLFFVPDYRLSALHLLIFSSCTQAMFVDFGYAEHIGGECILRFDDTNPEAEKQEYIDHINDIVEWMGYKPSKVTSMPSTQL